MKDNVYKKEKLNGRVAIVTGAAQGIGKAIAERFAKEKINVFLIDIKDNIFAIAKELEKNNVFTRALKADLTDKKEIKKMVSLIKDNAGKIDILVNCAGVVFLDNVVNLSEEYWDKTIAVNLKAPFLLSQAVAKVMIENNSGGKILNIASQAGVVAIDKHVAYCASKAGLINMTKVFAIELSKYNIQVNAISPTVILTELGKKAWAGKKGERMKKKIPAGRFGYPEEVAAAAYFLVTDEVNLITGENLVMDGGYTIQ